MKKDIYRIGDRVIEALRDYFHVVDKVGLTTFQVLDRMQESKLLSTTGAEHLKEALGISTWLRLATYSHNGGQKDSMSSYQPEYGHLTEQMRYKLIHETFYVEPQDMSLLYHFYYVARGLQKMLENLMADNINPVNDEIFEVCKIFDDSKMTQGQVHARFLEYNEAVTHLQKSLEENSKDLKVLDYLSTLCFKLTKIEELTVYTEKISEIILIGVNPNHPNVAKSYNNLGAAYRTKGEYNKAIEYNNQALEIALKIYESSPNHSLIALSNYNVGLTYEEKGEYDKAIDYYNKALVTWLKAYESSPDNPNIAMSYNRLGDVYRMKGEYDKAIDYLNKALEIFMRVYRSSPNHPHIAMSYNSFGSAYNSKGEYDKAIEYYNKALKIGLKAYGSNKNHPDIAKSYNGLVGIHYNKGEYDKSIEYFIKANEVYTLNGDNIRSANVQEICNWCVDKMEADLRFKIPKESTKEIEQKAEIEEDILLIKPQVTDSIISINTKESDTKTSEGTRNIEQERGYMSKKENTELSNNLNPQYSNVLNQSQKVEGSVSEDTVLEILKTELEPRLSSDISRKINNKINGYQIDKNGNLEEKVNEEFFYSGNHIVKIWEQYLKALDPTIKFYSSISASSSQDTYGMIDSIFNGLTQNIEVAIVLKEDGNLYQNKDGKTITICGEIDYKKSHATKANSGLATSSSALYNFIEDLAGSSIKVRLHQVLGQIKSYNNNAAQYTKITDHIVIFPYHASYVHWNLGQIELRFNSDGNQLQEANIIIFEPFGGGVLGYEHLIDIINSLEEFSRVKITRKVTEEIHIKQQNDSSSCGPITAENGKEFLKPSIPDEAPGSNINLLKLSYPHGARKLRESHITEINDDTFFLEQRDNITYEVQGDQPIENQDYLKTILESYVSKPENNWIKEVIYLIQDTNNDLVSRTNLNLFRQFLIELDLSDTTNNKLSSSILKSNGDFREGAINLINSISLTNNLVVTHKEKASNPLYQKQAQSVPIDKVKEEIQKTKLSVHAVLSTPENIERSIIILKEIENIRYKSLIEELAYKNDIEHIKLLFDVLSDLGLLYKSIGDLYGKINDVNKSLKSYTDSAVFYQYVKTIIEEKLEKIEDESDGSYSNKIDEIYAKLYELHGNIISVSGRLDRADQNVNETETKSSFIRKESEYNKSILTQLRNYAKDKTEEVENYAVISRELNKEGEIEDSIEQEKLYIKSSRNLFEEISEGIAFPEGQILFGMKGLLAHLYKESEKEFAQVGIHKPCEYTVMGLGSMALKQMTPYSDLEFAILIEREGLTKEEGEGIKQYFRNLTHLVNFKVINLGETTIPISRFGVDMDDLVHKGVNLDLGGKTPLGRLESDKPYELIKTIEHMMKYVQNLKNKAEHIDKSLPYILEKVCFVHGSKELISKYQVEVTKFLQAEYLGDEPQYKGMQNHQVRALKILNEGSVEIDYLGNKNQKKFGGDLKKLTPNLQSDDEGKLFEVKPEIYRLPDRMIYNLGMFFGVEGESVWDIIASLHNKGFISEVGANNLKSATSFATMLRLKTYLHNDRQGEGMSVYEFAVEHMSPEQKQKFQKETFYIDDTTQLHNFYYVMIRVIKLITHLYSSENAKELFSEDTLFDDSNYTKGKVHARFLEYDSALDNLIKAEENDPSNVSIKLSLIDLCLKLEDFRHGINFANSVLKILESEDINLHNLELKSSILSHLGVFHTISEDYVKALDYQNQHLEILQIINQNKIPAKELICYHNGLANIYYFLGDYDNALENYFRVHEIKTNEPNTEDISIYITTSNLAEIYRKKGEYSLAKEYLTRAIELHDISNPNKPNDNEIALFYNNLGEIYKDISELDNAHEAYRKAFLIWSKIYEKTPNHHMLAGIHVNLGEICRLKYN